MRKLTKAALGIILITALIFSMCIQSLAVANGEEEFTIFNDWYTVTVPKGYTLLYNEENYTFICEKNNDTYYIVVNHYYNGSDMNPARYSDSDLLAIGMYFESVLQNGKYCNYYLQRMEKDVPINGALGVKGTYSYDDFDSEPYNEDVYFIFGKNRLLAISFRSFGEFEESDVKTVLNSCTLNDELYGDNKFDNPADFTNAPPLVETHERDMQEVDEYLFGDSDKTLLERDKEAIRKVMWATVFSGVLLFGIPTLTVTVITIVLIVKYRKKKKKIIEYMDRYGEL